MKIVILDAATLGADIDLTPLDRVGQVNVYNLTSEAQLSERIADAEVIVTNKWKLNRDNLDGAAKLKLICVTATGYDGIDIAYCRARGIGVCNVAGYSTESVAQLTLAAVLNLTTRLTEYRDYVHCGAYSASGVANYLAPAWHELFGKTWGIVGGGAIGQRVAQMAEAMGCKVLMHRRKQDVRYTCVDLDTLCREADIITLHVPLNDRTRGMLSRAQIALMKKDAVVVNVARGAVTDEGALAEAVEEGRIGALGVDVYSTEPFPEKHPFTRILGLPNVCLTPHMAWSAVEARNRCMVEIAENIASFREGGRRSRVD